jgi:hypothetical protein
MEGQPKYGIGNIPAKKLLHYVTKAQLVQAVGPEGFRVLQDRARQAGEKMTAKFLKDELAKDFIFLEQLRTSPLGQQAFAKYAANSARLTDPGVRAKSRQVRQEMAEPRRGFLGCVATKITPAEYKECTEEYDNPEYQNLSLVPSGALKQSVYEKTGSAVLAPRPNTHISNLPRGLRSYIRQHPEEYSDYLEELKAPTEYMRNVGRNVSKEEREEALRGKRVRGQGEQYDGWM